MRRPRSGPGLRWKLTAAIAVVSALVALAMAVVVRNAARVDMMNNSRNLQDDRVQVASRNYESTHRLVFGARINDPRLPGGLRQAAERGQRATDIEYLSGEPIVWASIPMADNKILSISSRFVEPDAILDNLDGVLVVDCAAVVLAGSALSVLVGGSLSRRLRKAAVAARQVAEGAPDVRVRDAVGRRVRDETDELARAVDAMADALQDRLEAERRVTADIAHELRTPVTGLVAAAGLLPPGRPSELVQDRAQALRTLVEDLLEVSRLDSAAERADLQEIPLPDFVRRRVRGLAPDATLTVLREAWVHTDPRRLERVLGNLLSNAERHGRAPVEVELDGPLLRVRDHGPGYPRALLREGPSRFRTGSSDRSGQGHGLGLTIAAGQARVLGASLSFRNDDGAVAELLLPEAPGPDNGTA
ncbi:HAMP domain-containing sensor histidine kinase [Streptomyces sp. SL13]|uniref:histidine kinase n=1 Tax=Streptantibioticus silvisoli TaxID=2705255 RepID=A0AA90GXH9_9ACTN|nr:HAMP domain-containing sensor histidine kinase [Streptantibioticus silvisoli]MDI5962856.1 HAMP domain-containing sensor histidine kinase [Streptantibioticus silvisoli]MDI5969684.1 HAMP domain-containing sensor histidine kinase [Streptantibioticus silvisoli]